MKGKIKPTGVDFVDAVLGLELMAKRKRVNALRRMEYRKKKES